MIGGLSSSRWPRTRAKNPPEPGAGAAEGEPEFAEMVPTSRGADPRSARAPVALPVARNPAEGQVSAAAGRLGHA